MIKDDKRVRLFIGHYGSGKSEVSINYVTNLRKIVDGPVAFADLDIVNVYFRTREKKDELRSMGINPIDSSIETDTLDLPAVSAFLLVCGKSASWRRASGGRRGSGRVSCADQTSG